ncbi:MAG: hypothetical protein IKA54_06265 [Clostridia bacterium]|nr:hypothetical protein [Clostridia bacterium]
MSKINTLLKEISKFNEHHKRLLPNKCIISSYFSELYCAIRFGCSPEDFFRYRFYEKSNYERNKFITYRRSKKILKKYNDKSKTYIFQQKPEFNKVFCDYINRDWLVLNNCSREEFDLFVKKHKEVILKPLSGGQGKGIFKLKESELNTFNFDLYKNYICEEILIQHEKMSLVNPTSINTVRVLTFKGEIIACALRSGGKDAIVDNLHSNGVCAHIDVETGVIDHPAINYKYESYLYHPVTNNLIVGFTIPNWSILQEKIKQACKLVPTVQYVGWDVAILPNDIALIEGNDDPGHDVVQMIAQTGLYQQIKRLEK